MKERKWRIAMDVPAIVQTRLRQSAQARFPLVYASSITWAFKVEAEYPFESRPQTVTVYGLHTNLASFQSFAVRLGTHTRRPDGKLVHLTYCTVPGLELAHAGLFDEREVVPLPEPVVFEGRLERFPLWNRKPTLIEVGR